MKRIGKVAEEVTCTHCPHTTLYEYSAPYGTAIWCPCEDCHPGGLIQGREPFTDGRIRSAAATPVVTQVDDLTEVSVDPIHTL